jgi:hypothetical protein
MLQRTDEMDNYLAAHSAYMDSRFFPPKIPWGQRLGGKLGIPYRRLTMFFMGNAARQAEGILRSQGKLRSRSIEQSTQRTPPPHGVSHPVDLWPVRYVTPCGYLGLIPGVEALCGTCFARLATQREDDGGKQS